ncbi:MAG: SH3 domain-containing protein [Saccharofermentans sp.]|nr:SH3 domain-containing protein [Saccharofermentans sp.]
MKRSNIKKILSISLAAVMLFSMCGCKKKAKAKETEETDAEPTPIPVETTATPTTAIPTYSADPSAQNTLDVTWTEEEIAETTMYVAVSEGEFLSVRLGPSVDYDVVGRLSRNQTVTVVAQTSDGWYKTFDGYYVSGTYLSSTQSV